MTAQIIAVPARHVVPCDTAEYPQDEIVAALWRVVRWPLGFVAAYIAWGVIVGVAL